MGKFGVKLTPTPFHYLRILACNTAPNNPKFLWLISRIFYSVRVYGHIFNCVCVLKCKLPVLGRCLIYWGYEKQSTGCVSHVPILI